MRLIKLLSAIFFLFSFASCAMHEEIDLSTPGKGNYIIAADMSGAMEMVKSMGEDKIPDSLKYKIMDTTFSMASQIDGLDLPLTTDEKAYFQNATAHMAMNMAENKFNIEMKYPVKDANDLKNFLRVYNLVDSARHESKKDETTESDGPMPGFGDILSGMPVKGSPYIITENSIQRIALTKEDLSKVMGEDAQGAEMFLSQMTMSITIKLPRPVKEATGSMIKVSDDKMKVEFSANFSEMMDDPSKTEFLIKF